MSWSLLAAGAGEGLSGLQESKWLTHQEGLVGHSEMGIFLLFLVTVQIIFFPHFLHSVSLAFSGFRQTQSPLVSHFSHWGLTIERPLLSVFPDFPCISEAAILPICPMEVESL